MAEEENKSKTLRIKRDIFQKIWDKGIPLFFFNKSTEWDKSIRDYKTVWNPDNASIESVFYGDNAFYHLINGVAFIYAKPLSSIEINLAPNLMEVEYEEFNSQNYNHVKAVFLLYLSNRNNSHDKFACRELLWYLNNYFIDYDILVRVLENFDALSIRPFFIKELAELSRCLSIPKQRIIQQVVTHFGGYYSIYCSTALSEALKIVDPDFNINSEWRYNIFDLVRKVTEIPANGKNLYYDVMKDDKISNFYLKIRRWLIDGEYSFTDYDRLMECLRLFSPSQQLIILNRYFYAIKKGQTPFDIEILKKFKDNRFDQWGVYFHCTKRGSKPVLIGLQLMCDSILTFLSSGGTAFQSINGTLDMAYSQCNVNNPAVDFQLDRIVPSCNGGAIPNTRFKGFICYEIIQVVNDELFNNNEFIAEFTLNIINTFGQRHRKYFCAIYGDNFSYCENYAQNELTCRSIPNCVNYRSEYIDRWSFDKPSAEKCTVVNIFLKNKQLVNDQSSDITLDDINTNVTEIRENIRKFLSDTLEERAYHGAFPKGYINSSSCSWEYQNIYRSILKPVWMVIEPRNNAYIGLGLLAPQIGVGIEDYGVNREGNDVIKRKETEYIRPIISSSIQSMVETTPESDGKFYLNYDSELLSKLQATFYVTQSYANGNDYQDKNLCFLHRSSLYYKIYCAPEYTDKINKATNLPYFWCRGRECFMNALSEQTVAICKSWKAYRIFHLLEILGYPQVNQTDAGFEVSKLIQDFIGMVNRADQLFRRVICRECGHILFPIQSVSFNIYNNFKCLNPICAAIGKRIYLSQCFNCKSGVIDSRDSKTCPNGLRICPTCLSCCNDEQIEFRAHKYILKGCSVPYYIQRSRSHGHNNKKLYFCPKCGAEIVKSYDAVRNETHIFCSVCHTPFPNAVYWI